MDWVPERFIPFAVFLVLAFITIATKGKFKAAFGIAAGIFLILGFLSIFVVWPFR